MKLCGIDIKKFRSIEECSIRISTASALVGENNVGKSTLLRALNAFFNLEEERPHFANGSHAYSPRSHSRIILSFDDLPDDQLIQEKSVNGRLTVELKYLPKTKNFTASIHKTSPQSIDLEFIDTIKKYIGYIFIPPTRSNDELKWQEAKAIKYVISAVLEDKFKTRDNVTPKFNAAANYLQNNALRNISKKLTEYYGDRSVFEFNLNFKNGLTYVDFLTGLDFSISENGSVHNISDCGNGVQSLSIIALYRMLASLLKSNVIIGVEEPETNLHPQSQKQLVKRILSPSVESVESQVLFTTHSTAIIDCLDHSNIILFRKVHDKSRGFKTVITQVRHDFWAHYGIEELQYYKFHSYRNSDFFFSRLIIVVESSTDAEIIKRLLLQRNVNTDDHPVSVLNLDGIKNLKHPLFLLQELMIPFWVIVDKDFFVPYLNGDLNNSRDKNGFPKYSYQYKNESLVTSLIPKEADRITLLNLLKSNHSKALDLLNKYHVICMKYNLEADLIASDTAAKLLHMRLGVPENTQTKQELLVNRKKQIKQLEHLIHVIDKTPHKNLPNSFKRIKNTLEAAVRSSIK